MKFALSLLCVLLYAITSVAQLSDDHFLLDTEIALKIGKYDEVIASCNERIESNSAYYYAYGLRGIAYYHKTKTQYAFEDLSIALEHFPTEKFYYYRSKARHPGNYKGILEDLAAAIDSNPTKARYYYDSGNIHWKAFIETAEKHQNYNLAFVEQQLGFQPDPCTAFEQATALDDGYGKMLELCERFLLLSK